MSLLNKLKIDLEGIKGLDLEDVGEYVKITVPYEAGKEGKDRWTTINKVVKQYGGEWVSEGKWSHWKVPKDTPQMTQLEKPMLVEIVDEFERVLTKLRNVVYP